MLTFDLWKSVQMVVKWSISEPASESLIGYLHAERMWRHIRLAQGVVWLADIWRDPSLRREEEKKVDVIENKPESCNHVYNYLYYTPLGKAKS